MALDYAYSTSSSSGSSTNVSTGNSNNIVYIKGDADTDGSMRIIPDISLGTEAEFQIRSNGVWNDTGIVVAGGTIYLGRELKLSGGGEWLLTRDESENLKALVPHMRLQTDEDDGTETYPTVPILGAKRELEIISSGSIPTLSTDHELQWTATFSGLQDAFYVFIGNIAPSDPVTVEFWRNQRDVTGNLFFSRQYPASNFTANSVAKIEEGEIVQVLNGETISIVLKSDSSFSVMENFGDFYYALDYWPLTFETGVTLETGVGNFLADDTGNIIVDSNGDIVYSGSTQN